MRVEPIRLPVGAPVGIPVTVHVSIGEEGCVRRTSRVRLRRLRPDLKMSDLQGDIGVFHFVKEAFRCPSDLARYRDPRPRRDRRGIQKLLLEGNEATLRGGPVHNGLIGLVQWKVENLKMLVLSPTPSNDAATGSA